MTVELWSGSVPTDALDIVAERIARIVKRAQKHGFPSPSLVTGEPYIVERPDYSDTAVEGDTIKVQMSDVSIVAEGALKLGDYEFVGTVAALPDGSPFITYAPGIDRARVNEALVQSVNSCDHCGLVRDRKDTYLVIDVADQLYQVGSSCIKDFLGHDPAAITGWLEAVEALRLDDEEIRGWTRSATRFYEAVDILDRAARIVAKQGYVNKQKAEDNGWASTAELIRGWTSTRPEYLHTWEDKYPVTVESAALFNATVEAIRGLGEGANDWEADIARLFKAGGVQWRHIGILGSGVILGLRTQERKVTEKRGESNFIGEVGQRLDFTDVTVVRKRSFEGDYGLTFILAMSVNESDDLLWFASYSADTAALEEGDVIHLVGTVKKHELDRRTERPTTVLTRCKIVKES